MNTRTYNKKQDNGEYQAIEGNILLSRYAMYLAEKYIGDTDADMLEAPSFKEWLEIV